MFILNGERFEPLHEYEGYAIGDNGTFLTNKNKNKVWRPLVQSHSTTSLYMQVKISHHNKKIHLQIHRLVAQYFVDGYFEGAVVGHKDANINNNHYTNLKWITQKENIHQSYEDSGLGARRNYCKYIIYCNGEPISPMLNGNTEVKKYIQDHSLDTAYTSLVKYRKSRNYTLQVYNKTDC